MDKLKKLFRPQKPNGFEIEDLNSLPKREKDYQLKQLIAIAEQIPIYYENGGFPEQIGNSDTERDEVFRKIEQKYKSTLENIDKIFEPVLENMYQDLINEKCPYAAQQIRKEIEKAEKITNDLRERADLWKKAMRTIVCIETGALHTERFYREQCVTLENLEIFYAPYNEGKGLIALEKARERLLWEERQPLNERVIERTVKAGETGQNKGNLSTIERISR
ncbi:MAG TPA: hypothetical protein GX532_00610 [Clostridia bacterium]|nr:hypothetical protein [Clostridia bacterium]HHY05474.1 hypothetical protein [Clostridia bacterium]